MKTVRINNSFKEFCCRDEKEREFTSRLVEKIQSRQNSLSGEREVLNKVS